MTRYQPFNDLPAAQFSALVDDISKRGVLLPIIVDENGKTIDGHQRRRAAAEAGVECPQIVVEGLDEKEKETLALVLNLYRRHLSGVERTKAIQQLVNLGMSTRRMADVLGLSKSTVHREVEELSQMGQLDERPERTEGADGKSRPATMPKRPPKNVDPETGEIVEGDGENAVDDGLAPSPSTLTTEGGASPASEHGPSPAPAAPPSVPLDPALKMQALLSDHRKRVADWLAFDRHDEAIDAMTTEQRADYRSFVHSVWVHASATLDALDAPSRLKAVQ